jgi:hypothetical protein
MTPLHAAGVGILRRAKPSAGCSQVADDVVEGLGGDL